MFSNSKYQEKITYCNGMDGVKEFLLCALIQLVNKEYKSVRQSVCLLQLRPHRTGNAILAPLLPNPLIFHWISGVFVFNFRIHF